MKELLKKIIPSFILNLYHKRKDSLITSKFEKMNVEETFIHIYETNHWGSKESRSGPGSEVKYLGSFIKEFEKLIKELEIKSILDIPCGDFNWMQKVDLSNIQYTGADIVKQIIINNKQRFKENLLLKFLTLNLINDPLPSVDLIFVRDCLVHFSYKDISEALNNIKASGSKYLMTTTFPNTSINKDIVTGKWRAINLQAAPFYFPDPLVIINENFKDAERKNTDKSMGVWEINKIPDLLS